jgi:hypothetical protein
MMVLLNSSDVPVRVALLLAAPKVAMAVTVKGLLLSTLTTPAELTVATVESLVLQET